MKSFLLKKTFFQEKIMMSKRLKKENLMLECVLKMITYKEEILNKVKKNFKFIIYFIVTFFFYIKLNIVVYFHFTKIVPALTYIFQILQVDMTTLKIRNVI